MSLARDESVVGSDDGGQIRVTRVHDTSAGAQGPVILLPGMFTSRNFWISDKNIGLAAHLAEQGFDCWIAERRGIGLDDAGTGRPGADEHLHSDLPAVVAHVRDHDDRAPFWIGHSFGGLLAVRAAAEVLPASDVRGLVLLATQYARGKRGLRPPLSNLLVGMTHVMGKVPARLAGLGPEDEPGAGIRDSVRWMLAARHDPAAWPARLADLTAPVLAIASPHDTVDPADGCRILFDRIGSADKTWLMLDEASGFATAFDHPGMVVHREARTTVWPRIADWLAAHAAA